MPYIQVNVSQKLSDTQKNALTARLGEVITLIPGKTEAVTMVDISDGRAVYKAGQPIDGGFVDVRLYGAAEKPAKEALTAAVFQAMEQLLGIAPDKLYLNILEMDSWGSGGRLK
jgi:phenylpyruvate tautomerase PptA (4-oxalocrotonate tautomerase family)